jgi:hypothetical protein
MMMIIYFERYDSVIPQDVFLILRRSLPHRGLPSSSIHRRRVWRAGKMMMMMVRN